MSKFQSKYNKAKQKSQRIAVPAIKDQIDDIEEKMRSASDPDIKKALKSRLKALKIKMKSYRAGDPVKESECDEEAQAGVSTASVGSPTATTSDGGSAPAEHGSSHIYAPKVGSMASRKGDIKRKKKKKNKDKKRKKKKNESFIEYYFMENENA